MKELSELVTEIIDTADSPVGRLPDVTPVAAVGAGRSTCDPCSCRVSRCSGSRCCL